MSDVNINLTIEENSPIIPREIYGQFAEHLGHCIYGGIWVGEDSKIPNVRGIRKDVVKALKEIKIPVLRWPGGCFADEYHWMDGIGPRKDRPSIYNSHWGGVVENNHFGTHEFFDLCEQLDCEAYVCGNVGSGTVREMKEWVEYITSPADSPMANLRRKNGRKDPWRLHWFGVGNESWGCGGHMRPEYYADLYRQYNTYVRTYGGLQIKRIACGPNVDDYNWTTVLMDRARHHMDGLALHNYTLLKGWPPSGSATDFTGDEYRTMMKAALHMEELIVQHSAIMDKTDPEKRVSLIVDEWGTWHAVEPGTNPGFLFQQNSMRDALVASVHFDLFHRHIDRVKMANIAQMINVLQAMLLTDGDKMVKTPTYWVFQMYAAHQNAHSVGVKVESDRYGELPAVSATASHTSNSVTVSVSCLDLEGGRSMVVKGLPSGCKVGSARVLEGKTIQSHNTFEEPEEVHPKELEVQVHGDECTFILPRASVATITFKRG